MGGWVIGSAWCVLRFTFSLLRLRCLRLITSWFGLFGMVLVVERVVLMDLSVLLGSGGCATLSGVLRAIILGLRMRWVSVIGLIVLVMVRMLLLVCSVGLLMGLLDEGGVRTSKVLSLLARRVTIVV